ncbi:hypothetical protein D3C78_1591930 [compost metagenome]
MFLLQLLQFVFTQAEIIEFFELVTEQLVLCPLFVAGVGQPLQFLTRLAPALGGQLHLAGKVAGTGILVKQAAVGVGLE